MDLSSHVNGNASARSRCSYRHLIFTR
jgi:hypothetical protein